MPLVMQLLQMPGQPARQVRMTPPTASAAIFPVHGVDLAWSERGSGPAGTPTLVLVHGYTGSSHDFALQVDALAADRRVVTLDHRGHGHSTKTGHLEGYTIEQLAADLTALLEAVGGGPVDLLGHSMGGRVVMTLVLARPDLVCSLILMDTSAWSFLPPDKEIRELVRGFIDGFDPAGGMPTSLSIGGPEDTLIEAATPAAWRREKDAIFAGMDAYAVKALGSALMGDAADDDTSLRAKLPNITCPTTVIVGAHDQPLADQAPALAGEVADGRVTVIAGAYHSPQLTHAADWRAAVEDHLAWAAQ
jgi:pimeloyl-ACP methyl ester carboxylesterase